MGADPLFRRPVKVGGAWPARRHVMFGNCGSARGHTENDLMLFLEEHLRLDTTENGSSCATVSDGGSGGSNEHPNASSGSKGECEIYIGRGAVSNVTFPCADIARAVIAKVDGKELKGCKLNVCFADRSDSPSNTKSANSRFGTKAETGAKKKPGVLSPGTSVSNFSTLSTAELPGLELYQNYVSDEQAQLIWNDIQSRTDSWDCKIKRRVQHYGYAFNYIFLGVDPTKPLGSLPEFCYAPVGKDDLAMMDAIDRAIGHDKDANDGKHYFDQLTVNEYIPGIGIGFHVDTHSMFDDYMAVISLGDAIVLEFRRNGKAIPLFIPGNSLLIMSGEARYAWKHGIASRANDPLPDRSPDNAEMVPRGKRVSLTFRRVTHPKFCKCIYPEVCDSQNPSSLQLPGRLPRDEEEERIVQTLGASN